MWLAILIIGTIIGGVIGYFYSTNNYYNVFVGTVLCAAFAFVFCFGLKLFVEDKTFVCTDVTNGLIHTGNYDSFQKKLHKNKPDILGSEMVLEFFDKSVKCSSVIKQKDGDKLESFVLDELTEGHTRSPYHLDDKLPETPHTFQTESVRMELNEFMDFITSFTITVTNTNKDEVVFTYKRKYF